MRHRKKPSRYGPGVLRDRMILRSQAATLIARGALTTTMTKAKYLQSFVERLVTMSRTNTLASRRQLFRHLQSDKAVGRLLATLGPKYKGRTGGYTRVTRLERRQGDRAAMGRISFLDHESTHKHD